MSTDITRLIEGRMHAPAKAPSPNDPSSSPYPIDPWGRAINGSSAHKALAKTLNSPVRSNTDCTAGAPRKYRKPAPSAFRILRAGTGAGFGLFFHRYRKKMTPKKLAAF